MQNATYRTFCNKFTMQTDICSMVVPFIECVVDIR